MFSIIKPVQLTVVISIMIIAFIFPPFVTGDTVNKRILVDQAGRSVTVPDFPRRVVSLAPSVTEILYALNCQIRLKGVTAYSDFPDEAHLLPRVGIYIHPDIERIVSLKPDLCIAIKDGNPKETVGRLESLGIPVFAVNPRSIESIITSVIAIGKLMKAQDAANQLIHEMQSRIHHVDELVSKTDSRPKVFFQIGVTPIVSVGKDTFIHELIEKAGGINLAGKYTSYPRFSYEEVLAMSPDIIIITTMTKEVSSDDVKAQWQRWPQIPAVKNKRVYVVDSNVFDRPTPRLIDGLELLAKLIHPELYH